MGEISVYFISGHLDLTPEEFQEHYVPQLEEAVQAGGRFVVGDANGADTMAQDYLRRRTADVTVFHMFERPRNNVGYFPTMGSYKTDKERDEAMTQCSDADILWVREGREKSGTAKNRDRRAAEMERRREEAEEDELAGDMVLLAADEVAHDPGLVDVVVDGVADFIGGMLGD